MLCCQKNHVCCGVTQDKQECNFSENLILSEIFVGRQVEICEEGKHTPAQVQLHTQVLPLSFIFVLLFVIYICICICITICIFHLYLHFFLCQQQAFLSSGAAVDYTPQSSVQFGICFGKSLILRVRLETKSTTMASFFSGLSSQASFKLGQKEQLLEAALAMRRTATASIMHSSLNLTTKILNDLDNKKWTNVIR